MVPINVCPGSGGDHAGHSIIVARTAGYAKTYSRPMQRRSLSLSKSGR